MLSKHYLPLGNVINPMIELKKKKADMLLRKWEGNRCTVVFQEPVDIKFSGITKLSENIYWASREALEQLKNHFSWENDF